MFLQVGLHFTCLCRDGKTQVVLLGSNCNSPNKVDALPPGLLIWNMTATVANSHTKEQLLKE